MRSCGNFIDHRVGYGGIGGAVAIGTWRVEDDGVFFATFLFVDGGEGAEELAGDVGEDGRATGGDFVLGEEEEQAGEEVVDLGGGGEVVELGGEGGGDFGRLGRGRSGRVGVLGAERLVAKAEQAATHAIGEAMVASSRVIDGAGFSELLGHGWVPF